jgi:short subunit dehydrogenase-like uncharacterized protein
VDVNDAAGMRAALGRARLCMNCTGPYRFLGEPVVAAAIGQCSVQVRGTRWCSLFRTLWIGH